ncbi:MAG: hypothetical protein HQL41_14585 [Alphaproteobacteria bacterium]|nr:hypothetical protein [Alphaproteobacteria bacterium]
MREYYEFAEFLVAAWCLSPADGCARMPTSHGILDHALKEIVALPEFPRRFADVLTFADTSVGMRCLELPSILDSAQESQLTSEPNPTYETTAIKVNQQVCRRNLRDLGISPEEAIEIGTRLKHAVGRFAGSEGFENAVFAR